MKEENGKKAAITSTGKFWSWKNNLKINNQKPYE
jgi:hypothetical protein